MMKNNEYTDKLRINDLNIRQKEIFKDIISLDISEGKYFAIRAGRQSGKSWLLERIAIYYSLKFNNKINAFIMASNSQIIVKFNDIKRLIPQFIKETKNQPGFCEITFINESSLRFFSAGSPNSIIGNAFDYLFCDEFALWKNGVYEQIVEPTILMRPNSKIIMVSTTRGRNLFYTFCNNGMSSNIEHKRYRHYRMTYKDNIKKSGLPNYDPEFIEEKKKSTPENIFRQEYEGEFIFGTSQVFGDFLKYQISSYGKPTQRNYFGIDWAGTGEDETVLYIINENGEPVFIYECISNKTPEQVREMIPILKKYNASGYGEMNGLGKGGTEMIQETEIDITPFWMSNESKNELVSSTLINLSEGQLKLPDSNLCAKLDNEMSTFEVKRTSTGKVTYSHSDNCHDDYVDAMMMANKARVEFGTGPSSTVFNYDNKNPDKDYQDYLLRKSQCDGSNPDLYSIYAADDDYSSEYFR